MEGMMCLARDVSIQRLLSTHTLLPAATAALLTEPGAGDGLRAEEKLISSEIPSFLGSAGSQVPAQQGPGCPHCHLAGTVPRARQELWWHKPMCDPLLIPLQPSPGKPLCCRNSTTDMIFSSWRTPQLHLVLWYSTEALELGKKKSFCTFLFT